MKKKSVVSAIAHFFSSFKNYRAFNALSPDAKNIVFYSESGQDWHHFSHIIERLLEKSCTVCYITSDENDPGLSFSHQQYQSFCVHMGFWLILLFQFMKADCVVLTMIDLQLFHLKRSIHPVHYIYLFHAMGSTHMVDFENSYDHYDTILCVGQHQIEEIRARERLKELPAKNLVPHGYARVETLMNDPRNVHRNPGTSPTILVAPTWGPDSILPVCGDRLITLLLENGFKIILRPHYQTNKLMPEVVEHILTHHSTNPDFSYIDRMGDTQSLFDSDLLVCDWSSTSIEYALGLEKPVLYIDVPRRVRNENYMALGIEPLEVKVREIVGKVLSPDSLEKAPEYIRTLLADPGQFRSKINDFRKTVLFNIGKSVEVGAHEIARIAAEIKNRRHSG